MKIKTLIAVLLICAIPYPLLSAELTPHHWKIDSSGEIFWTYVFGDESGEKTVEIPFEKTSIPSPIMEDLLNAIQFAFSEGAAQKIHPDDLDHAHILCKKGKPCREFENAFGILLHAQEHINLGDEFYAKRNIYLGNGSPVILPCTVKYGNWDYRRKIYNPQKKYCTVHPTDLGATDNISIWFTEIDNIPEKYLADYKNNIRTINNKKILFGIPMTMRMRSIQ